MNELCFRVYQSNRPNRNKMNGQSNREVETVSRVLIIKLKIIERTQFQKKFEGLRIRTIDSQSSSESLISRGNKVSIWVQRPEMTNILAQGKRLPLK